MPQISEIIITPCCIYKGIEYDTLVGFLWVNVNKIYRSNYEKIKNSKEVYMEKKREKGKIVAEYGERLGGKGKGKCGALMMLMHAVSFSSRLLPLTHTYKHSLSFSPFYVVLYFIVIFTCLYVNQWTMKIYMSCCIPRYLVARCYSKSL